jgi:hypothetical protein
MFAAIGADVNYCRGDIAIKEELNVHPLHRRHWTHRQPVIRSTSERRLKIPADFSVLRIGSTNIERLHAGFFTTVGSCAENVAAAVME